jgi:hypothetical protein
MMLRRAFSALRPIVLRMWGIDPETLPMPRAIGLHNPARAAVRLSCPTARTSVPVVPRRPARHD